MSVRPNAANKNARRCLTAFLAISLCLLVPVYALTEQSDRVKKLITLLDSPDPEVRYDVVFTLGQMRAEAKEAIPALIKALKDEDRDVRLEASYAIGQISAEAKDIVPILVAALKNNDPIVRSGAANALGVMGPKAKEAVPSLIAALKGDDLTVRRSAAYALGNIGAEPRETVPALVIALEDEDDEVRYNAAVSIGQMHVEAKEAVPALIRTLKDDDQDVRRKSAATLASISNDLFDTKATETLPVLKEAFEALQKNPDQEVREQSAAVKRTIDYFETIRPIGFRERVWLLFSNYPYAGGVVVAYLCLLLGWLLVFWARPLWLLPVSASLSRYEPKINTRNMEISLPFRHLLLVSLFHYRERVLDRWVRKYIDAARGNFANKQTVKQRKTYVQTPVVIDEETFDGLLPEQMQPVFNKPKTTILVFGEGGAGKTSLACQVATWSMIDESGERLCRGHLMLPVLIEGNLEPQQDGKDIFTETVRGHLRELIGAPEAVPEEFLLQLLRKRRVLVIVDSLSELDDLTRRSVRPVSADFPAAALVVTSRFEDDLGGAVKTVLSPLRLKSDRLSAFMDGYLKQRGKRDLFTDEEYFESCRNLSQIFGERDITALIAKMYAEQMIASKEQPSGSVSPHNLPDLMLGYVSNINESVRADKVETYAVLRAAKVIAWECLKKTYRPTTAKRDDVLKALRKEANGEALLEYLEERLQLIQTVGAGKDSMRFSLDPLSEYLASLYLIEHYRDRVSRWEEMIGQLKAQPGAPETIEGFLMALLDCCKHHGGTHDVPKVVMDELERFLNYAPHQ